MTTLQIPTAEVFLPFLEQDWRYGGTWGGRGGAKSHFWAGYLIDQSLYNRGYLSVCIREIQRTLNQSSKRLIEAKITDMGVGSEFRVFEEKIETPGDGIIIFNGMQDHTAESIKSLEGFDFSWWDEAQKASAKSLKLLRPTIRKAGSRMAFSWNPKRAGAAIDDLLRGSSPPPRTVVVETHLWDNPWADDELWEEEAYDHRRYLEQQPLQPEVYNHIWRGAYETRSDAQVFKNWVIADFVSPTNATFRLGADFGFSIDPSVLIRCFIGRWLNNDPATGVAVADDTGRNLFIDYEAYRVGCDVDHTPALFAGSDKRTPARWTNPRGDVGVPGALDWPIIADSARPETISYMFRHGFSRIRGAKKGAGSVEEGINFLKSYDIVVHSRCKHVADEFGVYSWKTDPKTDLILPVLEDKKNHTIDACRYAVEDVRRARGFFS